MNSLKGTHLMCVLVVVSLCITSIALMAMYKGVDGATMAACVGGLGVVAGLGAGVLLKPLQ